MGSSDTAGETLEIAAALAAFGERGCVCPWQRAGGAAGAQHPVPRALCTGIPWDREVLAAWPSSSAGAWALPRIPCWWHWGAPLSPGKGVTLANETDGS